MRKECIICENEIYRSNRRGQLKERRSSLAITCSHKCSKIYSRVRAYALNPYRTRIKRLENEISKKSTIL